MVWGVEGKSRAVWERGAARWGGSHPHDAMVGKVGRGEDAVQRREKANGLSWCGYLACTACTGAAHVVCASQGSLRGIQPPAA